MKRVLIVCPRFAPSNAADSHRVRQSLPYYSEEGWEPTVLAVDPDEVAAPQDPLLLRTIPEDVEVIRVGALPRRWTQRVGVGSLEARALVTLGRAGSELLRSRSFDLVFFSTTALNLSVLGPRWQRAFGVPFVIDIHDPWTSDYYDRNGAPQPPGGALKYGLSQLASRWCEPYVLRRAAHVISVSPAYPRDLMVRYPWLGSDRFTVLPFGAPERDFDVLREARVENPVFDPDDGYEHWAYVGRAGQDMAFALGALFSALAQARMADPERYSRLRLHFIGTSYAEGDRAQPTVAPVAAHHGVADLVEERPHRVPYFQALQILLDADALVVPGSDDPGYTASKLYPYILAQKPLLAVFHEASTVVNTLQETEAGTVVAFGRDSTVTQVAADIGRKWFEPKVFATPAKTNWEAFEPYSAREMTRTLASVFDATAVSRTPKIF